MGHETTLVDVYRSIESELGWRVTGNRAGMTRKDGSYIMIPFNPTVFITRLEKVRKILDKRPLPQDERGWARGWNFVDVGAGLGFKLKIASRLGFGAYGIEFDKKYVDFARKFLDIKLMHRNALEVNYKNYDVIYFYRPIADEKIMERLEDRIISTMRDDAIVMGTYATYSFYDKLEVIGDEVAIKKGCKHLFKGTM